MKSHNAVKYIYNANPLYVHWKKHYCPQCKKRLVVEFESIIINSRSPDAKNYDFTVSDTRLEGDVEFRKSFFKCPVCGIQISFDKMKLLERKVKKRF